MPHPRFNLLYQYPLVPGGGAREEGSRDSGIQLTVQVANSVTHFGRGISQIEGESNTI